MTGNDVEREMRQLMAYGRGNMCKREEKVRRKEGNIPQTRAHQVIWDGWQIHPFYAQTTKEKKAEDKDEEMS